MDIKKIKNKNFMNLNFVYNEKCGLKYIGSEISKAQCDYIIERLKEA